MPEAWIAAGSNLRPRHHLRRALALLRRRWPQLRVSPACASPAAGFAGADFVNLVVGFQTDLPPGELKAALRGIEAACGRRRGPAHRARVRLDLDLLLLGDLCGRVDGIELPEPELLERPYLLGPLAQVAPGLRHPRDGRTLGELWRVLGATAAPLAPVDLGEGA